MRSEDSPPEKLPAVQSLPLDLLLTQVYYIWSLISDTTFIAVLQSRIVLIRILVPYFNNLDPDPDPVLDPDPAIYSTVPVFF